MSIKLGTTDMIRAYTGGTEVPAMYLGQDKVYSSLPYDAEITCMSSTGTQWINTGIKVTGDTLLAGMTLEVCMETNYDAASGKNGKPYFFVGRRDGEAYSGIGQSWGKSGVAFADDTPYVLRVESLEEEFYVDDVLATSWAGSTISGTTGNYIALFAVYNNYAMGNKYTETIYWARIYEQGDLVRDFIPVRIGSVGYMYDLITEQLYGNVGSGDFILGADV